MQGMRQGIGMVDHDLGRERARLPVAAVLELEQVAVVVEHGTFGESSRMPRDMGDPP
jgi:hypothetical protein